MLMDMRTQTLGQKAGRKKAEQGFTLTEIAIVLGIIGLILGAIWVAAAAVYTNMRTSKTTTELLDVVQNIRALYATSGAVDAAANMTTGQNAGNALSYIQAGIFPADTLNASAGVAPTQALNPWNGNIEVTAFTAVAANDSFVVTLESVPQQACISIITSTTGTGKDPGLIGVQAAAGVGPLAGVVSAANTFPVGAAAAHTLCALATQSIAFTFKLK